MWKNLLHPSINNGAWTKEEDALLFALATETGERGRWDAIAAELNTGRTALLCFVRWQQKRSHGNDNRKWTRAEDDRLVQLVERCKIKNFVPWSKVSRS